MARQHTADDAPRRGPERHTHIAAPPVDVPVTSPASAWRTPESARPEGGRAATPPERPASIRVKRKRRPPRGSRFRRAASRIGSAVVVTALLVGLALVIVLIVAPHHLF